VNASGNTIKMTNLQGATLFNKSLESNDETISLSSFSSGTYIIIFKDRTVKIIKE